MPRGATGLSAVKAGAKLKLKADKIKLKRPPRALYTEEERKEMSSLRNKNIYYRKRIKALSKTPTNKVTLSDIQDKIPNGDDPSQGLRAQLYNRGYFDEPDYSHRDIREWLQSNGDDELLVGIIEAYNDAIDDPNAKLSTDIEENELIPGYRDKIQANEQRLEDIKNGAQSRKDEQMLEYMDKKNRIKTGHKLLDDLSKGKIVMDQLSAPEQAAIRYAKNSIVTSIFEHIDFDNIPEEYRPIIKRSIYASVMEDPIQGLRDALRGNVSLAVAKKYGMDAGEFAGGMMDLVTSVMTGKPNVKKGVESAFGYMVSKTKWNKSLMQEVSEDLIDKGLSTDDAENMKMLGRDVVVDIAKDVISTGGNLYAAIPMIVKDVMIDAGKAGIKKLKYDKANAADEERRKKQEEAAKKAEDKFKGLSEEETEKLIEDLLKKYEQ